MGFLDSLLHGLQGAGNVAQQGAGTLANILNTVMAVRQGRLQDISERRATALNDPGVRSQLVDSPFLASTLGVYGSQQPGREAPGGQGPTLPGSHWQPNLPPMAPSGIDEIYKNKLMQNLDSLMEYRAKGPQVPEGMILTGQTMTPGGPSYNYGYPTSIGLPSGAVTGAGRAAPGQIIDKTKRVGWVNPPPGGKGGGTLSQLATSASRAKQAIGPLKALWTRSNTGRNVFNLLPQKLPYVAQLAQKYSQEENAGTASKLASEFTPSGIIGGIGGKIGESIPAIARDPDNPDAMVAQRLIGAQGGAPTVMKSLGEAGILSNQDISRAILYLIPGPNGTAVENENKATLLLERLNTVIEAYDSLKSQGLPDDAAIPQELRDRLSSIIVSGLPDVTPEQQKKIETQYGLKSESASAAAPAEGAAPGDLAPDEASGVPPAFEHSQETDQSIKFFRDKFVPKSLKR